jgi:hypothetical protein
LSNFKSNIRNAEAKVHDILEKAIKDPDQIRQWMDVFDDASLVESLPNIASGLRKLINVLQVGLLCHKVKCIDVRMMYLSAGSLEEANYCRK